MTIIYLTAVQIGCIFLMIMNLTRKDVRLILMLMLLLIFQLSLKVY